MRQSCLMLAGPVGIALTGVAAAQFSPPEQESHQAAVEGLEPYALCYRDTASATINSAVDVDVFQFFGVAGEVVQLALNSPDGLDPQVSVLDPQGAALVDPLGNDPPYGCSQGCSLFETFTLSATGVHTLLVHDAQFDEGGSYIVGLERMLPDRPIPWIGYGPTYSLAIGNQIDHDFVSFEGETGTLVSFALNSPDGLDPRMNIWAPDGTLYQTASCSQGCSLSLPAQVLPQTGTYLIEVHDAQHDEGGNVTLSLTCILANCPPPREDLDLGSVFCNSNPNSSGFTATLSARGSSDPADNYFSLAASDAPPGKIGIFFFGQNPTAVPFSQGVKCIANPARRLPPLRLTCFDGGTYQTPNLMDLPGNTVFLPGTTWLFQFWFRDQNPGATTNLSDGLEVTF